MKARYEDILGLTEKAPYWYDANGVPRYLLFNPQLTPNIYSHEVVLFRIRCQCCKMKFDVCLHGDMFSGDDLAAAIKDHRLHYGDPPIHCCVGDTMISEPIKVLEYWRKGVKQDWHRVMELEVRLEDD